jgi:hypothetical protein
MKNLVWINLLIGVWLIAAPFALPSVGLNGAWVVNDILIGFLFIFFAWWMLAAIGPSTGTASLSAVVAVWLMAAPFVLGYSVIASARWNDVGCGAVVLIVSAVAAFAGSRTQLPA